MYVFQLIFVCKQTISRCKYIISLPYTGVRSNGHLRDMFANRSHTHIVVHIARALHKFLPSTTTEYVVDDEFIAVTEYNYIVWYDMKINTNERMCVFAYHTPRFET